MPGLHEVKPQVARKRAKRVGRGIGSGHGKTSTRGHKGQKARSGGGKGPGFEGGQMPLHRRLPKRGFNNKRFARQWETVNVASLNEFDDGMEVTPDLLRDRRLIGRLGDVKVLGDGDLERKLTIRAHAFSAGALEKIKAAGGQAIVLGANGD